jgi:arylsulfatase A-like enzyme
MGSIDERARLARYTWAMNRRTVKERSAGGRYKCSSRIAWVLWLSLCACQKPDSADAARPEGDENVWRGLYARRHQDREIPLDFIFVSIDTLRADHLPFYGYPRATAGDPSQAFSLSWLANRALLYETCWAPIGKTLPSLGSFWTGQFPLTHGGISNPTTVQSPTYAERFKAEGFQTFAAVANLALGPFVGLARGFDFYQIRAKDREAEIPDLLVSATAPVIAANQPLMMWAHFMTPHQPYVPPAAFAQAYTERTEPVVDNDLLFGFHADPDSLTEELKQYCTDLYDAEILTASARLQQLLAGLDRNYKQAGRGGLLENAVVVFFADHGEELAERNGYFMHAKSLYRGVLQVPLLIAGAGIEVGKISQPLALGDVLPMLMDSKKPARKAFPASWQTQYYAWRTQRWTLIHNPGQVRLGPLEPPKKAPYFYPAVALFDRETDPYETLDVSALHPEIVTQMLDDLHQWFVELPRKQPIFMRGTDPQEEMQRLKELGYLSEVPDTVIVPWKSSLWKN